ASRDQHGRGPRLLYADGAGPDGGHGLLVAGAGLEGRARRPLRRRRAAADQSRWRPQKLRPSHRRQRAPHDVRDVAPAPRRGGPPSDREPEDGPHPQPGGRTGAVRELRVDRRGVDGRHLRVKRNGASWRALALWPKLPARPFDESAGAYAISLL